MDILLAIAFVVACGSCYVFNKDLFSPLKLYLLTLFICFFDIFVSPYRLGICAIFLGLLLIALIFCHAEIPPASRIRVVARARRCCEMKMTDRAFVVLIWLFSIIPVGLMACLVSYFGGPANYLAQLALRSLAFQGLNTLSEVAINLSSLLTVLYFGAGVIRRHGFRWWALYGVHFALTLTILLASGSRRYSLMPIIMILALFHYFRSAVSIRTATAFLALVLIITSIAGVLRLNQRGEEWMSKDLNSVERESVTAHFKYGLVPLEVIFEANVLNLRYGATFLAAVTNVVPRPFWPEKPESAGLAITRDYLGDRWLGASNLNAGFIAESIMNFGFPLGLIVSFLGLAGGMLFLIRRYNATMASLRSRGKTVQSVFSLVRYLHIALAITGLVTWETAIVSVPVILNLTTLWALERVILRPVSIPVRMWRDE